MPELLEFREVRFPIDIAFGSSGGPERNTEIITLGSGYEQRNQRWVHSRRRYEAGYGVKDLNALHTVLDFYEAQRGPLIGFRFRDPLDWKSCPPISSPAEDDQLIGTGDGNQQLFQLQKTYGNGQSAYFRSIAKPVAGSSIIAVDGDLQTEGVDYSVDGTLGQVTFMAGSVPANGAAVTAGFEFDVPVRFASDQMTISIAAFSAGDVPSIPIVEIRP